MNIRFENGIVVTLGKDNKVLWGGSVITDGDQIAAVGDTPEMRESFPDAEVVDCSGKIF